MQPGTSHFISSGTLMVEHHQKAEVYVQNGIEEGILYLGGEMECLNLLNNFKNCLPQCVNLQFQNYAHFLRINLKLNHVLTSVNRYLMMRF